MRRLSPSTIETCDVRCLLSVTTSGSRSPFIRVVVELRYFRFRLAWSAEPLSISSPLLALGCFVLSGDACGRTVTHAVAEHLYRCDGTLNPPAPRPAAIPLLRATAASPAGCLRRSLFPIADTEIGGRRAGTDELPYHYHIFIITDVKTNVSENKFKNVKNVTNVAKI